MVRMTALLYDDYLKSCKKDRKINVLNDKRIPHEQGILFSTNVWVQTKVVDTIVHDENIDFRSHIPLSCDLSNFDSLSALQSITSKKI